MSQAKELNDVLTRRSIVGICDITQKFQLFVKDFLFAQPRSACMGSVAHNILHVPSWGAMSCVLEEKFQVCLLTSFMTQLFQRNSTSPGYNHLRLKLILAQYLALMQLLFFPLILVRDFANLYSTAFLVDTRSSSRDCSTFSEARYQVDRGIAASWCSIPEGFPLVIALIFCITQHMLLFFETEPDFRFLVLNGHILI
jgi:hypothetical protein